MTSHVEQQVQARIAAAKAKAQQKKEQRAELAGRRTGGLMARHRAKAKRAGIRLGFCGACARPLMRNTYLVCSKGCGAKLCRGFKQCHHRHNTQCPRQARQFTDSPGETP